MASLQDKVVELTDRLDKANKAKVSLEREGASLRSSLAHETARLSARDEKEHAHPGSPGGRYPTLFNVVSHTSAKEKVFPLGFHLAFSQSSILFDACLISFYEVFGSSYTLFF